MALKNCIKSTANLNDDDVSDVLDAYQVNKDAGKPEKTAVSNAVESVINSVKAERKEILGLAEKGLVPRLPKGSAGINVHSNDTLSFVNGGTEVSGNDVLKMQKATEAAWSKVLPGLSRSEYAALATEAPEFNPGAATESELQSIRQRVQETGQAPAAALREMWGAGFANAPRRLQQAVGSDLAVPSVSPGAARTGPADVQKTGGEVRLITSGEQLYSQAGRKMTLAPRIDTTTSRKAANSIKRLNAWLLTEAQQEATGQDYLTTLLSAIDLNNISQSDQDTLNDVVFGDVDGPTAANRKVSLGNAKLRQEKKTDVVNPEIKERPLIEPPNEPAYSVHTRYDQKKKKNVGYVRIDTSKFDFDAVTIVDGEYYYGYPPLAEPLVEYNIETGVGDIIAQDTDKRYHQPGAKKGVYTPERAAVHETWLAKIFGYSVPVKPGETKTAVIMGGGGASGKGTVLGRILEQMFVYSVFGGNGYVHVDPDAIKGMSDEYKAASKAGDYRAASWNHEESSDIGNRAIDMATNTTVDPGTKEVTVTGDQQRNIVIDKVMDDEVKGMALIARLKKAGYEVHLVGVTVEPETALFRALGRYFSTGRLPLPFRVLPAHGGFNRVWAKYAKNTKSAKIFDNDGAEPILIAGANDGALEIYNKLLYNRVEQRGKVNGKEKTVNEIRRKTGWTALAESDKRGWSESSRSAAVERLGRRAKNQELEAKRRGQSGPEVTQRGLVFKTGQPVTFPYAHNLNSVTETVGKPKRDSGFSRWYEPSARYINAVSENEYKRGHGSIEYGTITFNNPLVMMNDSLHWKESLSEKYSNKRGKNLSQALIDDGIDGVVTVEEDSSGGLYTSEIIDLVTFDPALAKFSQKTKDAQGTKVLKGISLAEANAAIDKFRRDHKGYPDGLQIRVYADKESAFGAGAYIGDNNIVILIASDLTSKADAMETLQHEILAHYGLNLFSPKNRQKIINRILSTRGDPALAKQWAEIDKNYADKDDNTKAEEFLALFAQNKQGQLSKAWNDIVQAIRDALISLGWIDNKVTKTEINQLINAISAGIAQGVQQQTGINETMMNQEADTSHPSFKAWFKNSKVADRAGEPITVYHGTTHMFDTFNKDRGEIASDFGVGYYFTNSDYDANENYAGVGPDLTSRIERLAERLEYDDDGKTHSAAEAKRMAVEQLSGGEERQIEAYLSFKNPVIVGGENETDFWIERDHDYYMDMAKDEVDKADFTDEDGELDQDSYDDQLREQADTFYYEDYNPQERGPGVALRDALISEAYDYGLDGRDVWAGVEELLGINDGSIVPASDLVEEFKKNENISMAMDREGELGGNEYIRAAFEAAGYDGIIDNTVDSKFGTTSGRMNQMAGMDADTVHYIAFQPNQIKSAVNNSGEFSLSNDNIYMSRKVQGLKNTKVVNMLGRPKVVYHGTTEKFKTFGESGDIGYHFGSKEQARNRLTDKRLEKTPVWPWVAPGPRMQEGFIQLWDDDYYIDGAKDNAAGWNQDRKICSGS